MAAMKSSTELTEFQVDDFVSADVGICKMQDVKFTESNREILIQL